MRPKTCPECGGYCWPNEHTCPDCRDDAFSALAVLLAEVERLRVENSNLRDTLGWVEAQCPGKCAGVCFDALSGEHRREEGA